GRFEGLLNFLRVHGPDFARPDGGQQLGLVQHVVASYEDRHRAVNVLSIFAIPGSNQGERFDLLFWRDAKVLGDIFDRLFAGCVYQFGRAVPGGLKIFYGLQTRRRFFQIGCITALRTARDHVFARVRVDHELVRLRSAHSAGVRFHDDESQAAASKGCSVGIVVFSVRDIQSGGVDVEGVRVLHDELANAQQSRFRTRFVPKLGLDLIPDLG